MCIQKPLLTDECPEALYLPLQITLKSNKPSQVGTKKGWMLDLKLKGLK